MSAFVAIPSGCTAVRLSECNLEMDSATVGPMSDLGSLYDRSKVAQFLDKAEQLEGQDDSRCVDWYFAATRAAWFDCANCPFGDGSWEPYDAALAELMRAAHCFRRLDPRTGLVIHQGATVIEIPVSHHGFVWSPHDFQKLLPPPERKHKLLTRHYGREGLGVPVVVERQRCPTDTADVRFMPPKSWFAATAVLRFDDGAVSGLAGDGVSGSRPVLEFHDPLRVCGLTLAGRRRTLASDLTAPLSIALDNTPSTYLSGFVQPGQAATQAKLRFLEKYQTGKIPVVLIHGLYSDPESWADLINDLRSRPSFVNRFQLWAFRYPTGAGFLDSVTTLRNELQAAVEHFGSDSRDDSVRQMVLIGHSMGGLVAKLQVTHSEDRVWRRLANRPLDEIRTSPSTREMLSRYCYFEPAPHVSRLIFIATPHEGASMANGLVGKLASQLVHPNEELVARHRQLIEDNPGVFAGFVERGLPTTIDLLETSSPYLDIIRTLRIGDHVRLHNIIGNYHPISLSGPSDGVVPVSSAEHPCCDSTMLLPETHTSIHRSRETCAEILRILELHVSGVRGCR